MAKLIQDVVPPATVDSLPPSEELIAVLYIRGVTIQDIFGKYYQYEEHQNARDEEFYGNDEEGQHGRPRLTVGDAELAGHTTLPPTPTDRQPF